MGAQLEFHRERALRVLVFDFGDTGDLKKTEVLLKLPHLKAYFKPTYWGKNSALRKRLWSILSLSQSTTLQPCAHSKLIRDPHEIQKHVFKTSHEFPKNQQKVSIVLHQAPRRFLLN